MPACSAGRSTPSDQLYALSPVDDHLIHAELRHAGRGAAPDVGEAGIYQYIADEVGARGLQERDLEQPAPADPSTRCTGKAQPDVPTASLRGSTFRPAR